MNNSTALAASQHRRNKETIERRATNAQRNRHGQYEIDGIIWRNISILKANDHKWNEIALAGENYLNRPTHTHTNIDMKNKELPKPIEICIHGINGLCVLLEVAAPRESTLKYLHRAILIRIWVANTHTHTRFRLVISERRLLNTREYVEARRCFINKKTHSLHRATMKGLSASTEMVKAIASHNSHNSHTKYVLEWFLCCVAFSLSCSQIFDVVAI